MVGLTIKFSKKIVTKEGQIETVSYETAHGQVIDKVLCASDKFASSPVTTRYMVADKDGIVHVVRPVEVRAVVSKIKKGDSCA